MFYFNFERRLLIATSISFCLLLHFDASGIENISDKFSLSGLFKVDLIYDLDTPSGDRINYASIPTTQNFEQAQARIHARESRIGLRFQDQLNRHQLIAYIEGDFYGGGTDSPSGSERVSNATEFILRHAYVSYGNFLAGQTWSNYVDVKSFPETLDFSNDTGQAFVRQGQLRFTHQLNQLQLSYAIENPETDLILAEASFPTSPDLETTDPLFDVTARANYQKEWGHVSMQTVVRALEINTPETKKTEIGFGLGVSGRIQVTASDLIRFHYSQGKGIGRYIQEVSGSAGVIFLSQQSEEESTINIDLLTAKGGYLSYQRQLSKTVRANISSGFIEIDFDNFTGTSYVDDRTEELTSFHANLIWRIYPNFDVGIEHSIADVTKVSGAKGKVKRIQLSTKYRF